MARTVILDGLAVIPETEIIEHKNNNDELETTELVLKRSTRIEPFDMGLQCTITEDTTQYFITGSDKPVLATRDPNLYDHSITLIEPYKLLERITLSSLQFTQSLDTITYNCLDVADRLLKLIELEDTSDLGGKRVYDIDGVGVRDVNDDYIFANLSGIALKMYNKKAPEFKFNTPTLREALDEVFLLFDGRGYMVNFTTIGIKYYNVKNDEIVLSEVDEITGNQDIEKYSQKYDIYMEHAISEANLNKQARVYPSTNGWASVRSSETELTTNNFLMQVGEDIERILQFELLADVTIEYKDDLLTDQTFNGVLEVDMTEYLFTKRSWDALDFEFTNWINDKWKNNTVYFDGKEIKGWHQLIDDFLGVLNKVYNWHAILGQMLVESNPVGGVTSVAFGLATKPKFNTDVRDFMFRLKYIPKETVRVQLERDNQGGVGTLYYNQTARIVDSELLGSNAQNQLNREGEKELRFTKVVDLYADAFQLGDYYGDYIGVKVDNHRLVNYTLSVITLSKNFAKKSGRINLANKPRQTEISAENTLRNDIYNEYIEVSTSSGTNTSALTLLGSTRLVDTFRDVAISSLPVEIATWGSALIMEVTSQGIGKTMSFKFGFDNNISAGVQIAQLDSIYGNQYVRYAGTDGRREDVQVSYYGGFVPNPNTFANKALVAQELPIYDTKVTLQSEMIELPTLQIKKDSGEIYGLSYQLTFATDDSDIFIGNKLAQENALVVADTEQLYLYTSATDIEFSQFIDTSLTTQTIVTGTPIAGEVKIVTSFGLLIGSIEFTTNFNNNNWAIGNANGDTYLIVNKTSTPKVYFNPVNKRSD